MNEQDDTDIAQENIADSPPSSTAFNIEGLVTSPTSSAKRRRAIQKRVVQIPIKETEGSSLKGENNTPPSDSWAWRKYGQKPIKGWLGEMETTSSAVLESPIMAGYDADVASMFMPMREEDESLFADLGELPECSTVFRQGMLDDRRRFTAPWCGTTS
ncbi:WRKY domain [Sesbania bispinosa]|nr:WRKY domain [Sesbania bispinosa]